MLLAGARNWAAVAEPTIAMEARIADEVDIFCGLCLLKMCLRLKTMYEELVRWQQRRSEPESACTKDQRTPDLIRQGHRSNYPSVMMPVKIHALGERGGGQSIRKSARLGKVHHGYRPRNRDR